MYKNFIVTITQLLQKRELLFKGYSN